MSVFTTLRLEWLGESGWTERDFIAEPRAELKIPAGHEWSSVRTVLQSAEAVAILRILLEGMGEIPVEIRAIRLLEANGNERQFDF
jgi:hypothetical protein